jgi:hypothetical protein
LAFWNSEYLWWRGEARRTKVARTTASHTVPTRSLETPERSLSRKLIFVAFPKIHFFTGDNQIFFGSSHNGWLLPEFFSDFYI